MSLFRPATLACPSCEAPVEFQVCGSLNADRRPDLRQQVIDGTFQRGTCKKCSTTFRLDPELVYLDVGRNQWISAYPINRVGEWEEIEALAREAFSKSYGEKSSADFQELGNDLKPRLVFGWAALQEKILLGENGFDDVEFELLKIALLRGLDDPPIADDAELRLTSYSADLQEFERRLARVAQRNVRRLLCRHPPTPGRRQGGLSSRHTPRPLRQSRRSCFSMAIFEASLC
jgi:hypothetical protein